MAGLSPSPNAVDGEKTALIDLKAQQNKIRSELDAVMMRVLDHGK